MDLNRFSSKMAKFQTIKFALIAIVIGIVFAVVGGVVMALDLTSNSEYKEVTATVTSITDSFEDENCEVYFEYTVDGIEYSSSFTMSRTEAPNVGGNLTIYYDIENPLNISTDQNGGKLIPIIILVIGVVLFIVGVVLAIKGIKTKSKDLDQLNKVDMSNVSQEMIDEVKDSIEQTKEYYFHFCGKLNQSYILETPQRKPVVDMECLSYNPLKPYQFKFTNKIDNTVKDYEVTHTLTYTMGSNGWSFPVKSTFKLNGVNVFDVIAKEGFSINAKIEGLKLNFDVMKYGIKVATLTAAGANVAKADKDYGKAGELPTTGVFVINAKESDIDMIALIAFAVSRVEFF